MAGNVFDRSRLFLDSRLSTRHRFSRRAGTFPIATCILVLLTLFGALPIYNRVAEESPHGEGSISMLEHQLSRWKGKLFVLVLLGFVATDFIITITLSAADATAHVIENPFTPEILKHQIGVTLALIAILGIIFLRGFKEAIGIAVVLVGVYLLLNTIVISFGLYPACDASISLSGMEAGALYPSQRSWKSVANRRGVVIPVSEAGARSFRF